MCRMSSMTRKKKKEGAEEKTGIFVQNRSVFGRVEVCLCCVCVSWWKANGKREQRGEKWQRIDNSL